MIARILIALRIEMKGAVGGERFSVHLKDSEDPDDGTQADIPLTLTEKWQTYDFDLTSFETADLSKLYIVAGFHFVDQPERRRGVLAGVVHADQPEAVIGHDLEVLENLRIARIHRAVAAVRVLALPEARVGDGESLSRDQVPG